MSRICLSFALDQGQTTDGIDASTLVRGFERIKVLCQESQSELLVLGARAFAFDSQGGLSLRLDTRGRSIALSRWAAAQGVPYHDPNPQLFPRSVLFHPEDGAQKIWNTFQEECVDWIQGQEKQAMINARRQQVAAKAAYEGLVAEAPPARYQAKTGLAGQAVTVELSSERGGKVGGLLVPSLSGQRDGIRFQPDNEQLQFQLEKPAPSGSFHGRWHSRSWSLMISGCHGSISKLRLLLWAWSGWSMATTTTEGRCL